MSSHFGAPRDCADAAALSVSVWVQILYAWRIYQLGKWRVIPLVIIVVSYRSWDVHLTLNANLFATQAALAQAGGACAIAISVRLRHSWPVLHNV